MIVFLFFFLPDDFGSEEDNDFGEGEVEDEDGGSDYEAKKGKKGVKKGKVEKPSRRSLKRKRDSGGCHFFTSPPNSPGVLFLSF